MSIDPDLNDLKIYNFINTSVDPLTFDFTLIGLKKVSPSYIRGRKAIMEYKNPITGDVVVDKTFTDVRDANGILNGISITYNWYSNDGTIGLTKSADVRSYNKYEAETEERKRRERQIDYLIASAKGTPLESAMYTLFQHYVTEQVLYKEHGGSVLEDAIGAEVDTSINAILDITVTRANDPTKTISIRNSILYQIGAKTLAEIEAE